MKILFLARSLDFGGAERQMVSLAMGLRDRGHTVTVVTFYGTGGFAADLAHAGVQHVSLEKSGRWDLLGFVARLRRCVRTEGPDIVHSYLPTANVLTVALSRRKGVPRIVWGVRASDMQLGRYDWLERLSYAAEARLSWIPDCIIVNAKRGLATAITRGLRSDRAVVIPNGIDTARFRPNAAARREWRKRLGVDEASMFIGLPARFDPMKDHATFLGAARQLAEQRANVAFAVMGEGTAPCNPALDQLVQASGLEAPLLRLGPRMEMPEIYAALDIVCLSSAFGEGFPNVLGEAMAAGVPCVATRVGDAADVIGDTGEIVSPGDSRALADGLEGLINRLLSDPGAVREAARARIASLYDRERLVERTEDVLTAVLSGHPVASVSA